MIKSRINSIKVKLIILIIIILIPLTLLHAIRIRTDFKQSIESEMKSSQDFAEAIKLSFLTYLDQIWTTQYAMGTAIISNTSWEIKDIEEYMRDNISSKGDMLGFVWTDPKGNVLASTNVNVKGQNISSRAYFQRIVNGEDKVVSDLVLSLYSDDAVMPIAHAIKVNNELKGIMICLIDTDKLNTIFPVERVGKTSRFGLIDKNGMLVYRNGDTSIPFNKRRIKDNSPAWKALNGEIVKTYARKSGFDGTERMGIDYPIKEIGWECFVTTSVREILGVYTKRLIRDGLILLLVIIVSLMTAIILSDGLINSINKLKNAAEEVLKGNFTARADLIGNDELAATGDVFNRMTEGINQRITETEEYNKIKSQFFATISHELKTPLNIILGVIQLIEKMNNVDKCSVQRYMKIQKQNSFRLLRLINNLIDINKIEGNHLIINPINCDIVKVVEDITLSVADYTQLKGIELIFDTDIEEKITAVDPDKIERIMLNLLSNAIKFTETGGVIEVNLYDKKDKVEISVKDTGTGIPENMLEKIFDYFTQVDSTLRRKAEGSGIGLSLVKSLVDMHRGKIRVNSILGQGSEFIVELPVALLENENNQKQEMGMTKVERISIEFSDIYI